MKNLQLKGFAILALTATFFVACEKEDVTQSEEVTTETIQTRSSEPDFTYYEVDSEFEAALEEQMIIAQDAYAETEAIYAIPIDKTDDGVFGIAPAMDVTDQIDVSDLTHLCECGTSGNDGARSLQDITWERGNYLWKAISGSGSWGIIWRDRV